MPLDPFNFLCDMHIPPAENNETRIPGMLSKPLDLDEKKMEGESETDILPAASDSLASHLDDSSDGGLKAWLIVFAGFWAYVASWGYMACWGVFQAYYQETVLSRSTPSEIAWIGSLQRCLLLLPGIFVGPLFDAGYFKIPFTIGSVLIVVGTFLVPVCKVFWHFLLCQGLAIGLGSGLVFPISVSILTKWWNKRRGIAIGIAASGGAFGGTIFPIVMQNLLVQVGFVWTVRVLGFILLFATGLASLCLWGRLPSTNVKGRVLGLSVFRNIPFTLYCIACFVQMLGGFTVAAYISTSAISFGLSRSFAFYLIAITNGSSGVGRIVLGYLGDRIGPLNVMIPVMFIDAAATMAWPFCRTVASLTAIAVIYGFSLGAFSALGLVAVAAMGGVEDVGARLGTMGTIVALGLLCGPPLGGLLNETRLGYEAVGYFGGATILVSIGFSVAARLTKEPMLWSKC
ncbi:major facilitator superfamily domain-containing protein [Mycena crocata]|nr:major facilitator superfamily domain-containing protein [Mycena crocata]